MKNNIVLLIKGFIVGIAKIVPGVSGALLAISLDVYDKGINAITSFFSNLKENFKFLFFLGSGIVLSILIFSKIVSFSLNNYYVITTLFFIGLISGGVPSLINKVTLNKKNKIIILISLVIVTLFTIVNVNTNYVIKNNFIDKIVFFLSGLLEASGTVIPGISSTALLMVMGVYNIVINTISNLTNFSMVINNINILLPFFIGLLIGLVMLSILISYLFKKYYETTFSIIIGITLSNIFLLILKIFNYKHNILELLIGLIILPLGFYIANKLDG